MECQHCLVSWALKWTCGQASVGSCPAKKVGGEMSRVGFHLQIQTHGRDAECCRSCEAEAPNGTELEAAQVEVRVREA
jgi:hypothetical protein